MTDSQNLISILGIQSLPDMQKAKILDMAAQVIEQRLLLRLTESLSDAKREELQKILESDNKEDLTQFIGSEAPEFENWIEEETYQMRDELKSLGELEP
jgi:hypothetical protein